MKTRQTATGPIKKDHYEIHNKPIYGQLSSLFRELSFGFTESIKAKFSKLDN
jgi:hypothetical protein